VRADGGEERRRHLDRQVELAQVPGVDQGALAADADQKATDVFQRLLRRRKTDALKRRADQRFQPFERERQV
jgi:hypothetical protein